MVNAVVITMLLVTGAAFFAFAAMSLRVLFALAKRGPAAADDAYESGETLQGWFDPSKAVSASGPQDGRRLGDSSRKHDRFGEVLVEERASCRKYDL